jgi:hypothetical protein
MEYLDLEWSIKLVELSKYYINKEVNNIKYN